MKLMEQPDHAIEIPVRASRQIKELGQFVAEMQQLAPKAEDVIFAKAMDILGQVSAGEFAEALDYAKLQSKSLGYNQKDS
ncbi:MAG: hypothetical protein V1837_05950 [Candidatus Woesearchaeota archaeon]